MVRAERVSGAVLLVVPLAAVLGGPATALAGPRAEPSIVAPAESLPAVRRALALLPRKPERLGVVDAEGATPEVREKLLKVDAFVTKGGRSVYLMRHSEVLKGAQSGAPVYVCMLAAIIWHEMAHIDGADEAGAQRQEESLWKRFLMDNRVDRVTALRYLSAMSERRH